MIMSANASSSLPLEALPVEAMLTESLPEASAVLTRSCRKACRQRWEEPVFYAVRGGWRSIAKAHLEAIEAPVGVVHGHTLATEDARDFARSHFLGLSPASLASMPGVCRARRARTLPAAALVLDQVLQRLGPEARCVLRPRLARGLRPIRS